MGCFENVSSVSHTRRETRTVFFSASPTFNPSKSSELQSEGNSMSFHEKNRPIGLAVPRRSSSKRSSEKCQNVLVAEKLLCRIKKEAVTKPDTLVPVFAGEQVGATEVFVSLIVVKAVLTLISSFNLSGTSYLIKVHSIAVAFLRKV